MTQLPEHFDFIYDSTLHPEQVGALALMMSGEGPFHSHWLSDARPAGRPGSVGTSKSRRIVQELKALGYVKVEATWCPAEGLTRRLTSVRGNLALPFLTTGPYKEAGLSAPREDRIVARAKAAEAKSIPLPEAKEDLAMTEFDLAMAGRDSSDLTIQSEVVEAELVEEVTIVSTATKAKARKPTIAEQTKAIRQDPRWLALLSAYREMLRGIDKIGNLGEVAYAARQLVELLPELDKNPKLLSEILGSLPKYQLACNGCPVRLKRYLEERLWESYPPEKEIDWSKYDD